jgi:hypothetical protein
VTRGGTPEVGEEESGKMKSGEREREKIKRRKGNTKVPLIPSPVIKSQLK